MPVQCRATQSIKTGIVITLLMAILPSVLLAKSYKLQQSTIVPGATGEVKTGKDKNGNTKFSLQVKHLANPASLTPPKSTYVVWIQQTGAAPESQGVLKVSKNLEGKFEPPRLTSTLTCGLRRRATRQSKRPVARKSCARTVCNANETPSCRRRKA